MTMRPDPAKRLGTSERLWGRIVAWSLVVQRVGGVAAWLALGVWTALLAWFWTPWAIVGGVLAAAVAVAWVRAARERTLCGFRLTRWGEQRWTLGCAAFAALAWGLYLPLVRPDPRTVWAIDQARHPVVRIEGDLAHVGNVRDFVWRSESDVEQRWVERTYDLSQIESMAYVIIPLGRLDGLAHVLVCFGFRDGQTVAVSVEGRRPLGVPYRVVGSMFRKYELVYVVGEERDVLALRGAVWGMPVRFYPATTSPQRVRAIFESMLTTGARLADEPEFYHLVLNNCLTNITRHVRTLDEHALPSDFSMLMTGWSDRVAYELGYIDTDLSYEQAREAFRVDAWMRTAPRDGSFSASLREQLPKRSRHAAP